MKRFLTLMAAGSSIALAAPSFAASYVVTTTFDLANAVVTAHSVIQTGAQVPSVSLAVGDTLDFTINFNGVQTITAGEAGYLFAQLAAASGSPGTTANMTGTLKLLGTSVVSLSKTSNEATDHIGQQFNDEDFGEGDLNDVTFTGLRYQGVINSYSNGVVSRTYNTPSFQIAADSVEINGIAAGVPEPASWALMLVGFGAVGSAMRRGRARSVTFAA